MAKIERSPRLWSKSPDPTVTAVSEWKREKLGRMQTARELEKDTTSVERHPHRPGPTLRAHLHLSPSRPHGQAHDSTGVERVLRHSLVYQQAGLLDVPASHPPTASRPYLFLSRLHSSTPPVATLRASVIAGAALGWWLDERYVLRSTRPPSLAPPVTSGIPAPCSSLASA